MASLATERENFLLSMAREGVPADVARKVMRHASTIQRLAVAECNGVEDPTHRALIGSELTACGERRADFKRITFRLYATTCPTCRSAWHEGTITRLLAPFAVVADFQGDPRGACVKLKVLSGRTDDWGQVGICVPTPRY